MIMKIFACLAGADIGRERFVAYIYGKDYLFKRPELLK